MYWCCLQGRGEGGAVGARAPGPGPPGGPVVRGVFRHSRTGPVGPGLQR